ncbi:BQ2448_5081 [Microbotryum intermedium]|uniref:BQ2448_5081 protein n=1 Tax=Microbotryum intermedium TaxID=269621 RepID=A0A238F013_9BASI|nr:BQ2448_5081 [Microbotryum intermedium]
MGAFKNLFKSNPSNRESSTSSSSSSSPSSPSSSSYSTRGPIPTAAYAPPSSRPAWTPITDSTRPSSSGFGPRNIGEPRPWSYYASSSSEPPEAPVLQTRAYPVVASASTPDLAAIGNIMCQRMSTVRLDSESDRDMYWSYHTPLAFATPPRTSNRPPLPRPPGSAPTLITASAFKPSSSQSISAVPATPDTTKKFSSLGFPHTCADHLGTSSTDFNPLPTSLPARSQIEPPFTPERSRSISSDHTTIPQLPPGLPNRGGAGTGIGLGRPASMQPFHQGTYDQSRNITPQLPGAFPKSSGIDVTASTPPASSSSNNVAIKPKWLPVKSIGAPPATKVVSRSLTPGRENLTPTKTPSSTQRRSDATKPSAHASSSPSKSRVQCSGTTTSNKRCTRMIESSSGGSSSPGPLRDLNLASYCHQHLKMSLSEPGCFVLSNVRGGEHWVEYEDWILSDLDERTKVLLRSEMGSRVSSLDSEGLLRKPGIYVHELAPTSASSSTTYIKIGRSVKPLSRLSQWKHQCPSRKPIVRDILPRRNETTSTRAGGAMSFAERGTPNHHRWERLVLIEVSGRAKMMALNEKGKKGSMSMECRDCGQRHVEMFEVGRGAYDFWVRDVLERWERWCRDVIG